MSLRIKQKADIWSLGCVMSEAAIWLGEGYEGLLAYRAARSEMTENISKRLGDCFHDGHAPLATVFEAHETLLARGRLRTCDRVTPRVLSMIRDDMLRADPNERLDCQQLSGRASEILRQLAASSPSSSTFSKASMTMASKSRPLHLPNDSNGSTASQQRRQASRMPSNPQSPSRPGHGVHKAASGHRSSSITSNDHVEEPGPMSDYDSERDETEPRGKLGSRPSYPKPRGTRSSQWQNAEDDHVRPPQVAYPIRARFDRKEPTRHTERSTDPLQKSFTQPLYSKGQNTRQEHLDDCQVFQDLIDNGKSRNDNTPRGSGGILRTAQSSNYRMEGEIEAPIDVPSLVSNQPFSRQPPYQNDNQMGPNSSQDTNFAIRPRRRADLPVLQVIQAINWQAQEKENARFTNRLRKNIKAEVDLPGQYLLGRVGRRDHVCIEV